MMANGDFKEKWIKTAKGIRSDGMTGMYSQKELAAKYGVCLNTVSRALQLVYWSKARLDLFGAIDLAKQRRNCLIRQARALRDRGRTNSEIADLLNISVYRAQKLSA